MRLGVSIDAGKAPEKEPLAQSGGSGKVSKAEEAESAFVGQIKASKPSDRGQRQPVERDSVKQMTGRSVLGAGRGSWRQVSGQLYMSLWQLFGVERGVWGI